MNKEAIIAKALDRWVSKFAGRGVNSSQFLSDILTPVFRKVYQTGYDDNVPGQAHDAEHGVTIGFTSIEERTRE